MTVRLEAFSPRPRAARDDTGVSPVVGMILVLAISIVGIAAILYWGLPAIDEMKANVEYRSVTTQFTELDGTIKELVAGTTEKTAKRWQPAINRGSVVVQNNTEGWLMSAEMYNATNGVHWDFVWSSVADGDNTFTVKNIGSTPLSSWKVEAYLVTGTTTSTTINVTGGVAAAPAQMTEQAATWGTSGASQSQTFSLWVKDVASPGTAQPLKGGMFKFRIFTGPDLAAEAWFVNTGRVDYNLTGGVTTKSLTVNNGAVIAGTQQGSYTLINAPSMPPPALNGGQYRTFGRLIALGGNASFAGDNRFDLLISLYSTATLASYDCALTTFKDCVDASKIFVYGSYQPTWDAYLKDATKGYRYTEKTNSGITYLEEREGKMAFTLLGSTVILSG